LGTGGNYSTVISAKPLRLAITASAVHKGTLGATQILEIDEHGAVRNRRAGVPSAETLLHIEIVKRLGAGAVLHTHSSWNTMLSDRYSADGGFAIEGYEMLKALDGVRTHEHREWIPIVDNDQDMTRLAPVVGEILARDPRVHAFLLRRHGLYTWGRTLADAERHVEVLEFLFETVGRMPARGTEEISHGNAESSGGGSHAARSGGDQAVFGRARHRV
jgi:methylthioribulose-1-phosphate dehydratase